VKRGLALVAGLVAAALALYALLGRPAAPPPEEDIDDASRAALEGVLRQDAEGE
jgi:hypothetical protein